MNRLARLFLVICGLAFVVYMVVVPAADAVISHFRQPVTTGQVLEDMTFAENVRLRSAEAVMAFLFFAVGATVGSFLNVVAFRMPRGESLVLRGSRCPACGEPIASRDNIPVLGWLKLGGRCRACQSAISPRYPIVESACAAAFLLLYFVELISGGANLPVREPNSYHGVVWIVFYTKWDLVRIYLYHCFLLSALFAWTLMRLDGHRLPRRSITVALLIALILPLVWPDLLQVPVALWQSRVDKNASSWFALATAGLGATAGALMGVIVRLGLGEFPKSATPGAPVAPADGLITALALVGAALGWQSALAISILTLLAAAVRNVVRQPARRFATWPIIGDLAAMTLAYILVWRLAVTRLSPWWPGPSAGLIHLTVPAAMLALLVLLVRRLTAGATAP